MCIRDSIWSYTLANDTAHHHHDMAWMPNGHLLIMAWEYRSPEEAEAAGRLNDGPLWPPMIIEVVPERATKGARSSGNGTRGTTSSRTPTPTCRTMATRPTTPAGST